MRTTISIDDGVLEELKHRARESGSSVSELIEEAVRRALSARSTATEPAIEFELVTYGRGGRFSSLDLDRTSVLIGAEDAQRFGLRSG
jgi:hypothetical protein